MGGGLVVWRVLATLVMSLALVGSVCEAKCNFQGIFNFGDSNTDTGGFWAAFPRQPPPNGMTYFKKPSGRASDGRLIIDFLAQGIGIPFLSPYLYSIESNYVHGVNFATLASTVLLPNTSVFVSGTSPFPLPVQLNQMKQFKVKVLEPGITVQLPEPEIFGKSLYTIYIGQNDFTGALAALGVPGVEQISAQVVAQIAGTIKELYKLGGRVFLVLNLAPVGCYPALLAQHPHINSDLDKYGCVASYNNAVVAYNEMLKRELKKTRKALPNASVIYVDTFSVYLELFRHPRAHGLKYGPKACCGHGGGAYNFNPHVLCGTSKLVGGRNFTAKACKHPNCYVSWDGWHTTEAANKLIAGAILSESYFDPPFPLHKLCDIKSIG